MPKFTEEQKRQIVSQYETVPTLDIAKAFNTNCVGIHNLIQQLRKDGWLIPMARAKHAHNKGKKKVNATYVTKCDPIYTNTQNPETFTIKTETGRFEWDSLRRCHVLKKETASA